MDLFILFYLNWMEILIVYFFILMAHLWREADNIKGFFMFLGMFLWRNWIKLIKDLIQMSMFSKSKMLNSAGGKTKNFIFLLVLIFGTLPLSRFKPTEKKKQKCHCRFCWHMNTAITEEVKRKKGDMMLVYVYNWLIIAHSKQMCMSLSVFL